MVSVCYIEYFLLTFIFMLFSMFDELLKRIDNILIIKLLSIFDVLVAYCYFLIDVFSYR